MGGATRVIKLTDEDFDFIMESMPAEVVTYMEKELHADEDDGAEQPQVSRFAAMVAAAAASNHHRDIPAQTPQPTQTAGATRNLTPSFSSADPTSSPIKRTIHEDSSKDDGVKDKKKKRKQLLD